MCLSAVLDAVEIQTNTVDDIVFPEIVEVNDDTGSAQTVIPAALLVERGALGIIYMYY